MPVSTTPTFSSRRARKALRAELIELRRRCELLEQERANLLAARAVPADVWKSDSAGAA